MNKDSEFIYKNLKLPDLNGNIYVVADKDKNEMYGETIILGDPEGLFSLGKLLIAMSKIDQAKLAELPMNESEHIHLSVEKHIGKGTLKTNELIISRLDMKNGKLKPFYKGHLKNDRKILEKRKVLKEN